jgi:hypothetical protein
MRWPAACLGLAAVEPYREATARFIEIGATSTSDGADEEPGNRLSRGMTVRDRIRLTGPLLAVPSAAQPPPLVTAVATLSI